MAKRALHNEMNGAPLAVSPKRSSTVLKSKSSKESPSSHRRRQSLVNGISDAPLHKRSGKKVKPKASKESSLRLLDNNTLSHKKKNSSKKMRSKSVGDELSPKNNNKRSPHPSDPTLKKLKSKPSKRSSLPSDLTLSKESKRIRSDEQARLMTKQKRVRTKVRKQNRNSVMPLENLDSTMMSPPRHIVIPRNASSSYDKGNLVRRVHFHDKIRYKKTKHQSKDERDSLWYSLKELQNHLAREEQVSSQTRSCNNTKLLNNEGLLTANQCDIMSERQVESKAIVYKVQHIYRRQKEQQAATAIFRGGIYMEPPPRSHYYYDQDEAIAQEYEMFSAPAIQCAQQRASHLALHVNLLWDTRRSSSLPAQ